jgi:hypothetical protein
VSGALWALRGLWRAFRALGKRVGAIFADEGSGDLLARHATVEHWPPALEHEIRMLARVYGSSFCGRCVAGPDYPHGRCADCLAKLGQLLDGERTPTPAAMPAKP